MRKKLAAIITCLLVLAMGTTVFADADGSPSVTSKDQEALAYKNRITSMEISSGTVSYDTVEASVMDEAKTQADNAGSVDNILAMADVHPSVSDVSKGVTVTFRISGVSAGDNVYALHKKADGTWEVCNTVVGDGYVKVTLYSFSTVAIVKYKAGTSVTPNQQMNGSENGSSGQNPGSTDNTTNNTTNNINNGGNTTNTAGNTTNNTNNTTNNTTTNTTNSYNTNSGNSSAGSSAAVRTGTGSSSQKMSPKTGNDFPAIPVIAVLSLMGIAVCTGKAAKRA